MKCDYRKGITLVAGKVQEMTLGKFLKQRREALGLTGEQVAARVNRSHSWYNRIERDTRPRLGRDEYRDLARALELDEAEVLEADGFDLGLPEGASWSKEGESWFTREEAELARKILDLIKSRDEPDADN